MLIVIGHSNGPLRSFLYLFHVPSFFFISGMLYKDSYIKNPVQILIKRIKSLYVPFILYSLGFVALHNTFVNWLVLTQKYGYNNTRSHIYNTGDYIFAVRNVLTMGTPEQLLVPLWFITSLFTVTILMLLIDMSLSAAKTPHKESIRAVLISSLFVVGMLISHFGIILDRWFDVSLVALWVFYIGYLYKRYENAIPITWQIALVALLFLILNSFYGTEEISGNAYPDPAFFTVNFFAGTYIIIYISQYLDRFKNAAIRFIKFAGDNSYHILALHFLAFKLASLIIIPIKGYPIDYIGEFPVIHAKAYWWILYAVVGIVVPLLVVYIFKSSYQFLTNRHIKKTLKRTTEYCI